MTVLAGTETNVLLDGSLDYEDSVLEQLDWIVASLHTSFRLSEKEQTERMLRAMEHPLVDVIGHPTGRLIERRAPYPIDIDRVIAKAVETGTFLEINANPDRRDLNDVYAKAAGEAGVTLVIDSDAHWPRTLANMRYGVATARRAWLTPDQVANTRPWKRARQAAQARSDRASGSGSILRSPGRRSSFGRRTASCGRARTRRRRVPRSPLRRATGGATAGRRAGSSRSRSPAPAARRSPRPPRRSPSTISGQSRLNSTVPGSSSGSELVLRASTSRVAIPGVVLGRRPSQSPTSEATHHQIAAT